MSVALRRPWTIEQFLAWEEQQELRYEFDGFEPVAMVGGTEAHAIIQSALLIAVGRRLNRPPCRILGSDLKLRVAGRVRYPDAMIICSPPDGRRSIVEDPVIVFEILSPSTARTDLFAKNTEYRATDSIQRYIILEQTHPEAVIFTRSGDHWLSEVVAGDTATLALPEVGIELPLSEIYRDIQPEATAEEVV